MPPAARMSDMHVCPLVTVLVPHVGGPVAMGCPTVLIGALPAARVGDMAVCVGPPDVIVMGSTTVMIGGMPAARMGDLTAHGGTVVMGCFTVMIGDAAGGGFMNWIGPDIDAIADKSPILTNNIKDLLAKGWKIGTGLPGGGSFSNRQKKQIVIDPQEKGNPAAVVQTLAHESGHAEYTPDAYVPPAGLTKDQYVAKNVNNNLKDEGEATMTNAQVRNEINKNGGPDIGVAGDQSDQYKQIADKYPDPADRDKARQEIGDVFADGEHPSNDPDKTYKDYYSKNYSDYYDKNPPAD
jgi:uncharacterized Zn-binding protein involved in type VI secretion